MTGQELVKIREELGYSQASLSERLGVTRVTLRKYERAAEVPPYIELALIGLHSLRRLVT